MWMLTYGNQVSCCHCNMTSSLHTILVQTSDLCMHRDHWSSQHMDSEVLDCHGVSPIYTTYIRATQILMHHGMEKSWHGCGFQINQIYCGPCHSFILEISASTFLLLTCTYLLIWQTGFLKMHPFMFHDPRYSSQPRTPECLQNDLINDAYRYSSGYINAAWNAVRVLYIMYATWLCFCIRSYCFFIARIAYYQQIDSFEIIHCSLSQPSLHSARLLGILWTSSSGKIVGIIIYIHILYWTSKETLLLKLLSILLFCSRIFDKLFVVCITNPFPNRVIWRKVKFVEF